MRKTREWPFCPRHHSFRPGQSSGPRPAAQSSYSFAPHPLSSQFYSMIVKDLGLKHLTFFFPQSRLLKGRNGKGKPNACSKVDPWEVGSPR